MQNLPLKNGVLVIFSETQILQQVAPGSIDAVMAQESRFLEFYVPMLRLKLQIP